MESKSVVFEFSKEFADNSIDFAYHCQMRFTLLMHKTKELQGHHICIRHVEDLVLGDIVKVLIKYERYRLDEDFYAPVKEKSTHNFTFDFGTDFTNLFSFNTNKWTHPNS